MNVLEAIRDPNLFGHFIGRDLDTWRPWLTALKCLYGLEVWGPTPRALVKQCTGRDPDTLPEDGFSVAQFLIGRRGGKSRIAACVGAYEAALAGHESKLAKGEMGLVPVLAPSKAQAGIVHSYIRSIFEAPLLRNEVVRETGQGFELRSGITIAVAAGDWRTIRGYTIIAAIVDEAAFFGLSEESKIKSDTELMRALRPGLATTGGKLVVISSPYARRGWCYSTHQKNHGNPAGTVLSWMAPSRTMNPSLPQQVVDEALAEDLQAAKSEYLGEFRDDIAEFIPRPLVEALVAKDRQELPWLPDRPYFAFCDVSGGRGDDSALAIGHKRGRVVIVDFLKRYRSPHNPHEAVADMCEHLKRYRLHSITGDNYAGEFVSGSFERHGIRYTKSAKPKSALYLELLPKLCSGEVELLDHEDAVRQLAALERRTRSGGKDIVDHPAGGHDDVANVIAGVCEVATEARVRVGALFSSNDEEQ